MTAHKHPVLDGLPHSDDTPVAVPAHRPNAPAHGFGVCPECMREFEKHQADKLFCKTTHRRAFNNRWVVRGAVLAPLAVVARKTRNGTRGTPHDVIYGAKASAHADQLARRWAEEDKEAGRMPMNEYLRLRYLNGFDPV